MLFKVDLSQNSGIYDNNQMHKITRYNLHDRSVYFAKYVCADDETFSLDVAGSLTSQPLNAVARQNGSSNLARLKLSSSSIIEYRNADVRSIAA